MKLIHAVAFGATLSIAVGAAFAEQAPYPQTEEALQAEFDRLAWQIEPVTYQLAASHSNLTLPQGYALLTGDDARRFMFLLNGTEYPEVEAVVTDPAGTEMISFGYVDAGYITDDDWSELDPAALLEEVKVNTEAANEERKKNGISALHVTGWVEKPRFDAQTRVAYWAIDATDEETGRLANFKAIRLSRHGYHELVWVGGEESFQRAGTTLDGMLKAHDYEPGFRYADFTTGDKLAGFGIASLVAVAAGGEKTKGLIAGLIAAALLFLKKGWFVILALFGGGWAVVKQRLGRRTANTTSPAERSGTDGGGTA
jgi:uncharacterized membrane-anchored protein